MELSIIDLPGTIHHPSRPTVGPSHQNKPTGFAVLVDSAHQRRGDIVEFPPHTAWITRNSTQLSSLH